MSSRLGLRIDWPEDCGEFFTEPHFFVVEQRGLTGLLFLGVRYWSDMVELRAFMRFSCLSVCHGERVAGVCRAKMEQSRG